MKEKSYYLSQLLLLVIAITTNNLNISRHSLVPLSLSQRFARYNPQSIATLAIIFENRYGSIASLAFCEKLTPHSGSEVCPGL